MALAGTAQELVEAGAFRGGASRSLWNDVKEQQEVGEEDGEDIGAHGGGCVPGFGKQVALECCQGALDPCAEVREEGGRRGGWGGNCQGCGQVGRALDPFEE
eukprot:CAMPEP_0172041114 /NCGR_PEP_ID=MMETSP1041-20130122/24874_1 /TAXON_ID=464988 /ORGANISM="Hemiselmis andersenii, Strain CCMP439" /LENGTH=101 /DNA_ID=CAMNT_0012699087 /DNA_START=121 /DNA_END=424 /DNA_ORIENTATION=+